MELFTLAVSGVWTTDEPVADMARAAVVLRFCALGMLGMEAVSRFSAAAVSAATPSRVWRSSACSLPRSLSSIGDLMCSTVWLACLSRP